jgi:hypothetical protein
MMVRLFYICLLRLHPRAFHRRFAEEMLWIFDQTAPRGKPPLLADALISLARQRMLRPAIPEESLPLELAPVASDGVPLFYTFESFNPRAGALINGAILSAAIFAIGCFVFNYSLNEPLRSHLAGAQPGSRSSSPPSWGKASGAAFGEPARSLQPAGTDKSPIWPRLQSLFASKSSSHFNGQAQMQESQGQQPRDEKPLQQADGAAQTKASAPMHAAASPAAGPSPCDSKSSLAQSTRPTQVSGVPDQVKISERILQAYAGVYSTDSQPRLKISVSVEAGQLNLAIAGEPKITLLSISETRFISAGTWDSWIEFSKNDDGRGGELNIFQNDRHITAHRTPS